MVSIPLVSIITPTYNHEAYIAQCIESVLNQDYENWEMVIVDDGSTDRTWDVIQSYASKEPRILALRQHNRGIWRLAETYNVALNASRGELVAVLEGDDFWPRDKLAIQVASFEDPTIGFSYGHISIADQKGAILPRETVARHQWQPPHESLASDSPLPFVRDLMLLRGNVGAVSMMFRRQVLEQVGGFWQPASFPAVDFSTVLRVASASRSTFVSHPLGVWRKHRGQTTDINGVHYALGHTRAAIDHLNSLPVTTQQTLCLTEQDVLIARQSYLANAFWAAAQASLRRHEWKQARMYAMRTFYHGNILRKIEGVVAWLAAICRLDLNPVIAVLSRPFVNHRIAR